VSSPSNVPAVAVRDVGFAYRPGAWVLRHCTFEVASGHVFAVLGPNGRGKTTLLKLIAGSLAPGEGEVRRSRAAAFLPQSLAVPFGYSVFDMVLMGRARHVRTLAVPSRADEAIARDAIGRLNLSALTSRSFDRLSGGEQRLVLFARALAAQADILVLDEPASGLDLKNQGIVLRWIRRLAGDGMTVIFTTHQPQHADLVADEALLMFEGNRSVAGPAGDTLTESHLRELFEVELRRVAVGDDQRRMNAIVPIWPV